jgi:hypothetical protein
MNSQIGRAALVACLSVVTLSGQAARRTPSETADSFVGTWILNVAKSTYENMPTPKSGLRTFDYERDGMILTTVHTTSTSGATSFVHYLFTLDGREYEEVTRTAPGTSGPRTPTFVSATKADDRTLNVVFKSGGKVIITHEWTISADGKTFTAKRKATNAQGQPTYSVQVYDKQ